ncbi:MAG: hypothetical protein ABSD72_13440 [Terracidiphilus sp.]
MRPLWLPGIAKVNGAPVGKIHEWIGTGQYYFDGPVGPSSASFLLTPGFTLVETFAAEMSRFSSAAIETSVGIEQPAMPKSIAWLFIQTYYAAFYAAHSILRSSGISASHFGAIECQKADQIASLLGFSTAPLGATQFRCEYLVASDRLVCIKAQGRGIHEQFWRIFDAFLQTASNRVLRDKSLTTLDSQAIFSRLDDLRSILCSNGHAGGNWLSVVRNEVTYMHKHKAWFPYGRNRADCDRLFVLQREWIKNPDAIQVLPARVTDVELFVRACAFLVSLSVAVLKDMSLRCPSGNSFLVRGPLKLLSQVSA